MKALVVLRKKLLFLKRQVQGHGYNKDIDYKNTVDKEIIEVEEAIAELEALDNRSCDKCKHWGSGTRCSGCSHIYQDKWEFK